MSPEEMFDPVQRPKHYVSNGIEAIDVIEAFAPGNYHRGNALKYLMRAGKKGALVEDLRKAIWYIEREIKVATPTPLPESFKAREEQVDRIVPQACPDPGQDPDFVPRHTCRCDPKFGCGKTSINQELFYCRLEPVLIDH
jgi:hypothetical protein